MVAEFQRSLSFDHLTTVSSVGSSPAMATCETSPVGLPKGESQKYAEIVTVSKDLPFQRFLET